MLFAYKSKQVVQPVRNYYADLSDIIWILLEILTTSILYATFSCGGGQGVEMKKELIHMEVLLAVCQITCWISEYLQR